MTSPTPEAMKAAVDALVTLKYAAEIIRSRKPQEAPR